MKVFILGNGSKRIETIMGCSREAQQLEQEAKRLHSIYIQVNESVEVRTGSEIRL